MVWIFHMDIPGTPLIEISGRMKRAKIRVTCQKHAKSKRANWNGVLKPKTLELYRPGCHANRVASCKLTFKGTLLSFSYNEFKPWWVARSFGFLFMAGNTAIVSSVVVALYAITWNIWTEFFVPVETVLISVECWRKFAALEPIARLPWILLYVDSAASAEWTCAWNWKLAFWISTLVRDAKSAWRRKGEASPFKLRIFWSGLETRQQLEPLALAVASSGSESVVGLHWAKSSAWHLRRDHLDNPTNDER